MAGNITNITVNLNKTYSPVVMNEDWPALWRMILLTFLCIEGTIVNGYFVASFFVELTLRRSGLVYLACTGLADLAVTTLVTPGATIMLISKSESVQMCYILQFLAQGAVYLYNMSFAMVAVECYMNHCKATTSYLHFLRYPSGLISIMFVIIAYTTAGFGVWWRLDYAYCTRESNGNYTFRLITSLLLQAAPFTVTVLFLASASLVMRARARRLVHYKRSKQYDWNYSFTNLNIGCYLLYIFAWLPYMIIVNKYPYTSDAKYYNTVWLGLSRSFVTGLLFSCLNRDFRRAFARLFDYCCCKSTMSGRYRHHRAGMDCAAYRAGVVKVHILHHGLITSPQHTVSGCTGEAFCCDM